MGIKRFNFELIRIDWISMIFLHEIVGQIVVSQTFLEQRFSTIQLSKERLKLSGGNKQMKHVFFHFRKYSHLVCLHEVSGLTIST